MLNRYEVYNETLHYIEKEEQAGNLFVIRPEVPLQVDRMEKIQQKLQIYMSKAMRCKETVCRFKGVLAKIIIRLWRWDSLQSFLLLVSIPNVGYTRF